jgi:L-threonylcarbamoyladenylate synthase
VTDEATVKTVSATQTLSEAAPRVSGSLSAHYAPKTKLVLYDLKDAESLFSKANNSDIKRIAWVHFPKDVSDQGSGLKNVAKEVLLPLESKALARELYALLRHLDGLSLDCIFFEQLPDGVEWEAIRDRLGRASVGSGV